MSEDARPTIIDTATLKHWMDEERDFVLLDVLPADAFAESRLPGARNACIYETNFLEQARDAVRGKENAVVVYCSGFGSRASSDAADRLARAGYTEVFDYEGGSAAWNEAGHPFEGEGEHHPFDPAEAAVPADGEYVVDTEKSILGWIGRNVGGSHDGTLRLSGGVATLEAGLVTAGSFDIDMTTLQIGDMDGEMADLLKRHLGSNDFFAVAESPAATFLVGGTEWIEGATPGAPNVTTRGVLTVRGQSHPITFPAIVAARGDNEVALEAHFDIDRTHWGINYGSGKLYDRLGMHLVNDHVSVQARVIAAISS